MVIPELNINLFKCKICLLYNMLKTCLTQNKLLLTLSQVLRLRVSRKAHLDLSGALPNFLESTAHIRRDPNWRVRPVPPRLQRRHVDIGDLAPCDTERFIKGLQSPAQGIQVPLSVTLKRHMLCYWPCTLKCVEKFPRNSDYLNVWQAPLFTLLSRKS